MEGVVMKGKGKAMQQQYYFEIVFQNLATWPILQQAGVCCISFYTWLGIWGCLHLAADSKVERNQK